MNERNIAALTAILQAGDTGMWERDLAEWLASHGVLVTSALTDEELYRLSTDRGMNFDEFLPDERAYMRDELGRIAKGESA